MLSLKKDIGAKEKWTLRFDEFEFILENKDVSRVSFFKNPEAVSP